MQQFDTLVIGGGGIAGFSYIGSLHYLKKNKFLDSIKTIVASSAGSFLIFLWLLGYDFSTIQSVGEQIDLSDIVDISVNDLMNFVDHFGVNDAENLIVIMRSMAKHKNVSPDITFLELYRNTNIEFLVTVSCLNTRSVETLSYKNSPDMRVVDAIRISISIPFIFHPIKLDGRYYVDGAFFINCYQEILETPEFLGRKSIIIDIFHPYESYTTEDGTGEMELWMYSRNIFMARLSYDHQKQVDASKKIFRPDVLYISLEVKNCHCSEFNISQEKKRELFDFGYFETKMFSQEFVKSHERTKITTAIASENDS